MDMKLILQKTIKDKVLITGFSGVGKVGHLALKYLLKSAERQGDAERIGYILSPTQPPFVEVTESGIGNPYEFYEIGELVFLDIRFPPLLSEQIRLAEAVTQKAKEENVRGFLLLGGLDERIAERVYEEDPLPIVGVSNEETPFLSRMNLKRTPEGILISGGIALILSHASHLDIPSLALFAPAEKGEMDRKSALRLARKVSDFFSLDLDFEGVEEEILLSEVAERQIEELEDKMERQRDDQYSDLFT